MSGIIDLHCDTLLECYLNQKGLQDWSGHLNLGKLRDGGALAQCFAIFLATGAAAERRNITLPPYELFQEVYRYYLEQLENNKAEVAPACTAADVKKNQKDGKLSAILTVEDSILLEGQLERVDELAEKGVRMAALTWNYENSLGYPNSREPKEHALGLKSFGIDAVRRMNEKGIMVDVSHLSEGGFYDVAKHVTKPFLASHSCARALCDHRRNLSDGQLRVIGEAGGVVGVNFYAAFLTGEGDFASNSLIAAHAAHIADQAGIEAVALGSDFDGIDTGLEMGDYAGYPRLIDELSRRFTDGQIDRICSGNFLRLFEECCG